jgi:hypothetical protein
MFSVDVKHVYHTIKNVLLPDRLVAPDKMFLLYHENSFISFASFKGNFLISSLVKEIQWNHQSFVML